MPKKPKSPSTLLRQRIAHSPIALANPYNSYSNVLTKYRRVSKKKDLHQINIHQIGQKIFHLKLKEIIVKKEVKVQVV